MAGTAAAYDDSSSSGSDGYSSPSDIDDSDNDDTTTNKRPKTDSLMSYRPQKFVKAIGKTPSPVIRGGRKKKKNDVTQTKMRLLERKAQLRKQQQQQPKRKSSSLDSSDEDSDSDMEDTSKSRAAARTGPAFESRRKPQNEEPKSELIELLESSPEPSPVKPPPVAAAAPIRASPRITRAATATTNATKQQAITLLSSDDEDDDDFNISTLPRQPLNLPPAVAASLRQAQQAKARLEQAQVYQAHDVHVDVEEPVFVSKATPTIRRTMQPKAMDMGKVLNVACRCGHLVIGGTKEALSKDQQSITLKIREKEPLSALIAKFCTAHSLPPEAAKIELKFDGQKLDPNKTPTGYEMEDEDLIDVSASAPYRSN